MIELTPPLSPTIAPLTAAAGGDVRRAVARIAAMGLRSVQLSAAQKGLRPRELDHRARRDLLALLARSGLMLGGLDLFIPHEHWTDPADQDRAVTATLGAIDLAGELGRVPLSLSLPIEAAPEDVVKAIIAAADAASLPLAIHAEHDLDALAKRLEAEDLPSLGAGLDPAALLAGGGDPADAVLRLADHLRTARLDDHARTSVTVGGGRCIVGHGRLNIQTYRAALATCGKLRNIVVELRDLADPFAALQAAADAWDRASPI